MKTILQVDDDANDVFLLHHALKKVGVANPVHVASDGQQAIDYLQGAGEYADRVLFPFPDLVLMDLKLPYVMGLDVLRWIRAQPNMSLIVVILSASAAQPDIAEAYRLGANAFLTKPSEAAKLEDMVKAIKAFWLTHNTVPSDPLQTPPRGQAMNMDPADVRLSRGANFLGSDPLKGVTHSRNGHVPIPASVDSLNHLRKARRPRVGNAMHGYPLTKRQLEVVRLVADGCSNLEIASRWAISIKTVEKHRQAVMDKLNIHEVASLTRYAVTNGLVQSMVPPARGLLQSPQRDGDAAQGRR